MRQCRTSLLLVFIFMTIILCGAQQNERINEFLGRWETEDNSLEVMVIKDGDLYYIIEFVRIKHELFFSGDGRRALFHEWGKGPGGYTCGLEVNNDGRSIGYFSVSEFGEWIFSKTFYRQN